MPKQGREFEEAVYAFANLLDKSAEVIFDHHVPDRDTGTPRQCDVWINATFGGHWPLSILVSCKDHGRKLNVSDIGTFADEVRSTRANTGIIYSSGGFTKPALEKAKANGYSCCQLYRNERVALPDAIAFDQYTCSSSINIRVEGNLAHWKLIKWSDLFQLEILNDDKVVNLLSLIETEFNAEQHNKIQAATDSGFPEAWTNIISIGNSDEILTIFVTGTWKKYRARIESSYINGSYCLSNDSFVGSIYTPSIDTFNVHPGDGWIEITEETYKVPDSRIIVLRYGCDIKSLLSEALGAEMIPIGSKI